MRKIISRAHQHRQNPTPTRGATGRRHSKTHEEEEQEKEEEEEAIIASTRETGNRSNTPLSHHGTRAVGNEKPKDARPRRQSQCRGQARGPVPRKPVQNSVQEDSLPASLAQAQPGPRPFDHRAPGALRLEGRRGLVVQQGFLQAQQADGDEGDADQAFGPRAHHGHELLVVSEPQAVLEEKRLRQGFKNLFSFCF